MYSFFNLRASWGWVVTATPTTTWHSQLYRTWLICTVQK